MSAQTLERSRYQLPEQRPNASVICIEADPNLHGFLQENVRNNSCAGVRILCSVLGAPTKSRFHSIVRQTRVLAWGRWRLSLALLLSICGKCALMTFLLNSDCGRRCHQDRCRGRRARRASRSTRILSSNRRPVIVFEFADWAEGRIIGQHPGDAQAFLIAHGYSLFSLEPDGTRGAQFTRPVRQGTMMIIAMPPAERASVIQCN